MKRKTKPRVTQLDRIELKLRHFPHVLTLSKHCAVLASHNRRLLEENDTLRRWLKRLQEKGAPS